MKEYNVTILFNSRYTVRIPAKNKSEAEEKALEMFNEGDFGEAYDIEPNEVVINHTYRKSL